MKKKDYKYQCKRMKVYKNTDKAIKYLLKLYDSISSLADEIDMEKVQGQFENHCLNIPAREEVKKYLKNVNLIYSTRKGLQETVFNCTDAIGELKTMKNYTLGENTEGDK